MLLVIDIGNTNIKVGIFTLAENGTALLLHSWRLNSDIRRTSDEYGVLMESFFNHLNLNTNIISGIIMSSVMPSLNYTIEHMCGLYFHGIKPLIVGASTNLGIINCYDPPESVGSDRLCNCVAAYFVYGGPAIVIDFGTATSFNVVSEKGEFLGGLIYPGIKVASDALINSAAMLPKVEYIKPEKTVCRNTIDAIQSGIINGYVGMVEHIIDKINKEQERKHTVIATGGMSSLIASETDKIDILAPILTLEGLAVIAEKNGLTV